MRYLKCGTLENSGTWRATAGRSLPGRVSLAEVGGVCGSGEYLQLVFHKLPAGRFCWTCNITSVGTAVSKVGHSRGRIIHEVYGGGILGELLARAAQKERGYQGSYVTLDPEIPSVQVWESLTPQQQHMGDINRCWGAASRC